MTTRVRGIAGLFLSVALYGAEPQSRAVSQLSPLRLEVLKSGRVAPASTVFHRGETIRIRAETVHPGRLYFYERHGKSGAWKPLAPAATTQRSSTVRVKAGRDNIEVLALLAVEEAGEIDPGRIAADQPSVPGESVSWTLPGTAAAKITLQVR